MRRPPYRPLGRGLCPVLLLTLLWASPASPAESPAEAAYVRAERLARAGRIVEAQAAFREVLRLDPAHPRAPERLRELYGQGLTAAQAIAALEAEVQANPTDPIPRSLLGVLYGRERRWDEALAVFRAALAAEPRAADAQANVGWIYLEVQRSTDALHAFEAALRLQPRLARAHAGYGAAVAEARGDFGAALASYRQALLLDPGNAAYLNDLGWLAYKMGRVEEAVRALRQ
ncbi:MAG: tetratricopeptide repeat protein, partial [Candidatus Methylomirabilales bacterium]